MRGKAESLMIAGLVISFAVPLYAQSIPFIQNKQEPPCLALPALASKQITSIEQPSAKTIEEEKTSKKIFKHLYNIPRIDEKKEIRAKWTEAFRTDVWSPYYKAKEVEGKVCDKFKVQVFSIKGRPQLEDDRVSYIFKASF
ncbi:MAG: hypothetical protein PHG40_02140 [Candidatus Omnitrophica bacterium]|nr:hypothetical protein [Candidatus Omnitrophota bacterium]